MVLETIEAWSLKEDVNCSFTATENKPRPQIITELVLSPLPSEVHPDVLQTLTVN